ncbi:MAG: TraB/GumN family protein [Psychrobium sp.]
MLFSKLIKQTFVVLILATFSLATLANGAKPAFWKVEHNGTTSYMLGSIHIGDSKWYPLSKEIMDGFAQSKQLVIEVDATDPVKAMAMQQQMMLPKGQTLKTTLSPATYEKLSAYFAQNGMPMASIEPMKPWAASTIISLLPYLKAQLAPQYGVDPLFIARAKMKNMPLIELETMQFQVDMLARTFSDEKMLLELLELPDSEALKLIDFWKKGDMAGLDKLMVEQMTPTQFDEMLVKRNKNWVAPLSKIFDGKTQTFVVVGAAHMAGEFGMPTLLKKAGYKVTRVQ